MQEDHSTLPRVFQAEVTAGCAKTDNLRRRVIPNNTTPHRTILQQKQQQSSMLRPGRAANMQQEKLLFGPIIRKYIRTTAGLEYCCMAGLLRNIAHVDAVLIF